MKPPEHEGFRAAVRRLHAAKDAAYRNAWKKRGETISVLANIARKVDRLEAAFADAPDLPDESLLDTAVDLLVYAIKYQTYLADVDQQAARVLFGGTGVRPYSDGPAGFDRLLDGLDLRPLTAPRASPSEASRQVLERFADLEGCFPPGSGLICPAAVRLGHARRLTTAAVELIAAFAAEQPRLLAEFVGKST